VALGLQNRAAMRPVLFLALLAAPALASAQRAIAPPPGGITFPDVIQSADDGLINEAECAGPGTLSMRWDAASVTSGTTTQISSYQVWAHSRTTAQNESSTGPCPTASDTTTGLVVDGIGEFAATDSNPNNSMASRDVEFATSAIVAAAGKTCDQATDQDIIICVQARIGGTGGVGGIDGGAARGKVTLSIRKPGSPRSVSVVDGNNALNVSWSEPSPNTPVAEYYRIEAVPISTTTAATDPVLVHTSGAVTTTGGFRFGGLVNTVIYRVRVFSFSTADNRNDVDPQFDVTAMPELANDFWKAYRAAGGQEQGGCGYGVAGPIALLAVAAGLVLLRRRS
jgi:hypothetical protein